MVSIKKNGRNFETAVVRLDITNQQLNSLIKFIYYEKGIIYFYSCCLCRSSLGTGHPDGISD
jgi:hypothetical protein